MSFLGVFGHVALDYILQVPRLPEANTSIQLSRKRTYFGGTAGNVARAAARLGVETSLAAFVGTDFPADYMRALKEDGVDTTDLRILPEYNTPTAWIFSEPKGNQVAIVDQGPMKDASGFEVLEHTVKGSKLIHVGTGRPEYYRKVMKLARMEGKEISFDPSQEIHYVYDAETFRELLSYADFFFGNRHEFQRALDYLGLREPPEVLEFVKVATLTEGGEGSTVYSPEGSWRVPRIPPRAEVDVTGAGDAYRAGFYAGLYRGLELPQCGLMGASVASFCVEAEGPQNLLPRWDEAWKRASAYADEISRD